MVNAGKVAALPFRGFGRKHGRQPMNGAHPPALITPLEARQVRRAAQDQRELGVGRWPGMTHEEFESRLLRRIHPLL